MSDEGVKGGPNKGSKEEEEVCVCEIMDGGDKRNVDMRNEGQTESEGRELWEGRELERGRGL